MEGDERDVGSGHRREVRLDERRIARFADGETRLRASRPGVSRESCRLNSWAEEARSIRLRPAVGMTWYRWWRCVRGTRSSYEIGRSVMNDCKKVATRDFGSCCLKVSLLVRAIEHVFIPLQQLGEIGSRRTMLQTSRSIPPE
jgi:hypothetical protein